MEDYASYATALNRQSLKRFFISERHMKLNRDNIRVAVAWSDPMNAVKSAVKACLLFGEHLLGLFIFNRRDHCDCPAGQMTHIEFRDALQLKVELLDP